MRITRWIYPMEFSSSSVFTSRTQIHLATIRYETPGALNDIIAAGRRERKVPISDANDVDNLRNGGLNLFCHTCENRAKLS